MSDTVITRQLTRAFGGREVVKKSFSTEILPCFCWGRSFP